MQHLCVCIINGQPEAERRKMRTALRKQQTWAKWAKERKIQLWKEYAHTSISKRRVYNEKCHQIPLSLSLSIPFFLTMALLGCLFWCRAQPPVAYVIIEQTKINILHAKYHSGIPTFVIFRCTWLLQYIAMCAAMWRWWWFLLNSLANRASHYCKTLRKHPWHIAFEAVH